MPEARGLGSSRIRGSRGESGWGFGSSGVRDLGAEPPELRTARRMGNQHWGARGPGILECDSEERERALETPSWAGSPQLGSRRAVTRRLQGPGGNPGRPGGPGGCTEGSCRLAPLGWEGSGTPRPVDSPYLVCAAFARPGRARGALLPPVSHWGGSGMHQETPGLLPFLRGGAPRLGLFLPALLPSPVGRLGSRASGSALSAPVGTPLPAPEPPASEPRLPLSSPLQRKPGFAGWAPPVERVG